MSLSGAEADERRSDFLKRFNVRLIRFENKDVFEGLEGVLEEIRRNFECREACLARLHRQFEIRLHVSPDSDGCDCGERTDSALSSDFTSAAISRHSSCPKYEYADPAATTNVS